jgi:hypothetical protein
VGLSGEREAEAGACRARDAGRVRAPLHLAPLQLPHPGAARAGDTQDTAGTTRVEDQDFAALPEYERA